MKTLNSNRPVFQGDLMIRRIDAIPASAKPAKADGDRYILAHSETGHHHVIDRAKAELFEPADDTFIAWLRVVDESVVRHERSFDTHEPITLPPGNYEIRRQRENAPEGWRRAAD